MIELKHVSKTYDSGANGGVDALKDVSLTIEDGDIYGIIGMSGAGKSTLLNMIGGLDSPTSGTIIVDGQNIEALSRDELADYRASTVGFVFQSYNLVPTLTVLENVALVKDISENPLSSHDMLRAVGLEDHMKNFPSELSGGEQQRAAIAVALANKPDILLADEPTGAVDTRTADTIYELFHKLNKELGITIIIVTHDMALAGRVDRTVLISDGKVSTEKLKKHPAMEYTVLDKAHRIKLTDEMLEAAGIESNKVKVDVQDGRLVISRI